MARRRCATITAAAVTVQCVLAIAPAAAQQVPHKHLCKRHSCPGLSVCMPVLTSSIGSCTCAVQVPNGAAGWYLLGRISRLTGRPGRAAEFYSKALQLDPMLWVAYTELCMLGEVPKL